MTAFTGQGQMPYQVRRMQNQQAEEAHHLQEREDLLQALKKSVQVLLMLAVQKECPAYADEQQALLKMVGTMYEIFSHGIKFGAHKNNRKKYTPNPAEKAGVVWELLQRAALNTPSIHVSLVLLQRHLTQREPDRLARSLVRLCICDRSILDLLVATSELNDMPDFFHSWAFLRDVEHSNTLPTLLGGLVTVSLPFDWLYADYAETVLPATHTHPAAAPAAPHLLRASALPSSPANAISSLNPPHPHPHNAATAVAAASKRHKEALSDKARAGGACRQLCPLRSIPEDATHLEEDEEWIEVEAECTSGVRGRGVWGRRGGGHSRCAVFVCRAA